MAPPIARLVIDLSRAERRLFLVPDDFHRLTAPGVPLFIEGLLADVSARFHLVLVTRNQVGLQRAGPRARAQLVRPMRLHLRAARWLVWGRADRLCGATCADGRLLIRNSNITQVSD